MFRILKRILASLLKPIASDSYTPNYSGQWKAKGSHKDDNWQWVERKPDRKFVLNVYNIEEDFVIAVDTKVRGSAVETVDCRDEREVDIALSLLDAHYSTLGNVVITREVE